MKKPLLVWCAVDPKGKVLPHTVAGTKTCALWVLVMMKDGIFNPIQARQLGFTVRRFRLEDDT